MHGYQATIYYLNTEGKWVSYNVIDMTNTTKAKDTTTTYPHETGFQLCVGFYLHNKGLVAEYKDINIYKGLIVSDPEGKLDPVVTEPEVTEPADPNTFKNLRAFDLIANNKVYASGVALTSNRDKKKNIENYTESALSEICSTPIRQYHLKGDLDDEIKRIGIILQEAPLNAIDLRGEGVDLYQMVTMSWKAIQELKEEINILKANN